jgi:hypothetical protein
MKREIKVIYQALVDVFMRAILPTPVLIPTLSGLFTGRAYTFWFLQQLNPPVFAALELIHYAKHP